MAPVEAAGPVIAAPYFRHDLMSMLVLFLATLLSGWILSLRRQGFLPRALVIASVAAGAFVGGYAGAVVAWLVLRLDGSPVSQHEWIAWVDGGLLGMVAGLLVGPTLALAMTGRKKEP